MKKYKFIAVAALAFIALFNSCTPEASYWTDVMPETFFDSQDKVYQRMMRPFTHFAWYTADQSGGKAPGYRLQEWTTDATLTPSRYNDWYDGGRYIRIFQHDFVPSDTDFQDVWNGFSQGYGAALSAKTDLSTYVDYDALGFPAGTQEAIMMQLDMLIAYFVMSGLDHFGGVPLYESDGDEPRPRSTAQETYNYIENILKRGITDLPVKTTLGAPETGSFNRAAAALMLAQLYFNSERYIGQSRFDECAKICEDILAGVYGQYALDDDWRDTFGFENQTSPEIILTIASDPIRPRDINNECQHYRMNGYWGNSNAGGRNNGWCLVPSLDAFGRSYIWGSENPSDRFGGPFRLGSPYGKFHDQDVRKQLHAFDPATKTFRGMFYVGQLVNPYTGGICTGGNREFSALDTLVLVDQIARISNASLQKAASEYEFEGVRWGEENSGVRPAKVSPIPDLSNNSLLGVPDIPVYRLAEVYYTLAECKWRAGDKAGAAELINTVRARYFEGADPDPVTAENLDEWRFLDEWLIEFLAEGRRRIDLVRWDKYVTEPWWDHVATNDPNKNIFPIPSTAFTANNLLEQNPGYDR
jgi:hypothetical protein